MWITRYAIPFALAVAVLLACLAPRDPEPAAMIRARELMTLAQLSGGPNYTYSKDTGTALDAVTVARPAKGAKVAEIESALIAAGFRLKRVGPVELATFLVEPAR